jgi:hypothetical protein
MTGLTPIRSYTLVIVALCVATAFSLRAVPLVVGPAPRLDGTARRGSAQPPDAERGSGEEDLGRDAIGRSVEQDRRLVNRRITVA